MAMIAEQQRLLEAEAKTAHWRRWGPYLSERQWGTVREDYSPYGTAWDYFPHDHARSRAYRWGEDGIGGICDNHQRLCLALALWNGRDPILKERLFGLTGPQGNHGEDVKEYYFYLDSTPTHSYMKFLYKYPQAAFPYRRLVEENARRGRPDPEFELMDTGVFEESRYFDVTVEYAKANFDDVLVRISAVNRGPEPVELHLLPTLWFRNTWDWDVGAPKPRLSAPEGVAGAATIAVEHPSLGFYRLAAEGSPTLPPWWARKPPRTIASPSPRERRPPSGSASPPPRRGRDPDHSERPSRRRWASASERRTISTVSSSRAGCRARDAS